MNSTSIVLNGYRVIEKIYEGSRTQVYRGTRLSDQKPVVLKLLKSEYPTFNELVQFRNQYAIAKNLDLPGIVQPLALENYRNSYVLVLEDFGSISLPNWRVSGKKDSSQFPSDHSLEEFFDIAIQIAQILEGLYKNRVIHKDIKPQNILINPETREIKLIDFSISSLLPKENQEIRNPNVLEGTLAYMSPEQTGRMNRGMDYRTDFYSLGVTFYELLTGQLPFQSHDPMELVHCHIARMPTPPIELVPEIPQLVNDIVMKLMAKTAEERYQTAFGLRYDLEICRQQWQENGSISQFPLGQYDISEHFIIPEKLYGREAEVATLLAAFERVAGRGNAQARRNKDAEIEGTTQSKNQNPESKIELMLVAGFSGIGKTAVVNEVHKPIVGARGYFIKGKFDQFKRDIPFWAWVQALQNLIQQLLTESTDSLHAWTTKILNALGENAQVIIEVIPELELLIGKQPPVPELEGSAAQNRFNLLFRKFIRVFATSDHPLVIFLDDLQWADSASLKLMQLLMSETDTQHLLLIGAYRDNEVSNAHPLMLTLDEIRKIDATVHQITLAPLDSSSLNHLIADTLSCSPERAMPLTELVLAKTQGNPFFSTQFLKSLYEDGLISFVPPQSPLAEEGWEGNEGSTGGWQCDIAQVRALAVSQDVVQFMASQLRKLPDTTQTVLKLAACIGNSFDLATLSIVYEKSQAETASDLWRALQEGLIIPSSDIYKFFQKDDNQSSGMANGKESDLLPITHSQLPTYKFLHDRVQQAAYFLIPESQKQSTHLRIGRLLLSNTPEEEREEKIFDIVNQLNMGVELIDSIIERDELAQLNLIAGRKAKASTAYAAAVRYLTIGIGLVAAKAWQEQYELILSLHDEAAEAAFLHGDFIAMEQLTEVVLQQAKTLLDKVKVYQVKIQASMVQNQQLEAFNTGLTVLALLGIEFPQKVSQLDVELGLQETKSNLAGKRIEDLIDLPQMTAPDKLAAMKILSSIFSAAFQASPQLFPLIVCKQVNLSIQNGNTSLSAFAYSTYALILCGIAGDIESGYQFGKLALRLLDRINAKEVKTRTMQIVYSFIIHWQEPLRTTVQPLQSAYQIGLETGDVEYAAYCGAVYCLHLFFSGKELDKLEQDMATYTDAIARLKQETALNYHQVYQQFILNLLGKSTNPCLLVGEAYDESKMLPIHQKLNDKTALYYLYFNKSLLCYLFSEYHQAAHYIATAEHYLDGVTATINIPLFYFYDSLVKLASYHDVPKLEQDEILLKVTANQAKMEKWAQYAPMNYRHKFNLVEAERYRVLSQNLEAMDYYDRAIAEVQENAYLNEEALAHELAAKFYLTWGKQIVAQTYLTNAYYTYARWGAKAKVEDLEKRYPQFLAPILNREKSFKTGETIVQMTRGTIASTSSGSSSILDLETVIKASQAISGEIQLDRLLSTLMQVAIENAGASKGALILSKAGDLAIEATAIVPGLTERAAQTQDKSDTKVTSSVLQSIPIHASQDIPVSVIHYVWHTQETLVLNDAKTETRFAADPYIIGTQPQSILCTLIRNQGKAIGILYLENNLATGTFTPDRLEVLQILSSQAAISVENARLYANLEEYNHTLETKVAERTQELSQALESLKATQEELIQSEKMAALGQLVAGVAHEINTPLGAIRASAGNVSAFLTQTLEELPELFKSLPSEHSADFSALLQSSLQQESILSLKEERKLKRTLIRQLESEEIEHAYTVADTLVDMGVYGNIEPFLSLLRRSDSKHIVGVASNVAGLKRGIKTINTAIERAAKVVFALKTYARYDSSSVMKPTHLIEGIETVLTLYQSQLKRGIDVKKNYGELPLVLCYPDELNQVWTNLIHNALQAMDYRGTLTLDVTQEQEQVKISITDSGKGIPEEIQAKIFEAFFTTKNSGEGSGLGLHITKKIVEKHNGKITCKSQPGQTTFNVFLPIEPIE